MNYDKTSPSSIELYAKKLIGKTARDIIPEGTKKLGGKGKIGQYIEKYHFGYELNSDSAPDFPEAGVELKVTGYKALKNKGEYSAKERLSLNVINFEKIINEEFETSSFLYKNKLILLIFYLYEYGDIQDIDFQIDYAQLFTYPDVDYEIIKQDWNKIVEKIKNGKAHELSEGDTLYLGASTKGAKTEKNMRHQPYSEKKARQRAFSLKNKYLTHILRKYIMTGTPTYESIIKSNKELKEKSFEEVIIEKVKPYYGKTLKEITDEFNLNFNSKGVTSLAALRILGIKSNQAEEFVKANINVKAVRIDSNGKIDQHMSFPTFVFKELAKEEWETSTLRTRFAETKYFFIVYEFDKHKLLRLKKCFFWNMPVNILDTEIKSVWEKTVFKLLNGVTLTKKGTRTYNDLPSAKDNFYAHVRPHATVASYDPNTPHSDQLPDGQWMTKQCFWLNRDYILQIINEN